MQIFYMYEGKIGIGLDWNMLIKATGLKRMKTNVEMTKTFKKTFFSNWV